MAPSAITSHAKFRSWMVSMVIRYSKDFPSSVSRQETPERPKPFSESRDRSFSTGMALPRSKRTRWLA